MIPTDKLIPGSKWRKSKSGKTYEVIGFAVDTTTNNAVVVYRALPMLMAETRRELDRMRAAAELVPHHWLTRPIGEFLGDVLIREDESGRTFAPRFVPME